jgi:hypothetical protein
VPSDEDIAQEKERFDSGYYSAEQIAKRAEDAKQAVISEFDSKHQKEIDKINLEYQLKRQVLVIGGKKALNACIFYKHTNELTFNWYERETISEELIKEIAFKMELPEGIKVMIKDGNEIR